MFTNKETHLDGQAGQASRLLLVIAIIVFVAIIIVYLVMKMITPAPKPITLTTPVVPQPVYEKQLENIDFTFENSRDLGNVLKASDAKGQNNSYLQDLTTTERFVIVTIGAQNRGKLNIPSGAWDIQNIVDADGREFTPVDNYTSSPWLPDGNSCGALLQPYFNPLPCTKIYKVAIVSGKTLKIRVETGKGNDTNNFSSGNFDTALLDLIIK